MRTMPGPGQTGHSGDGGGEAPDSSGGTVSTEVAHGPGGTRKPRLISLGRLGLMRSVTRLSTASPRDRLAAAATFITVAGVVAFVVAQLQPGLIFLPTMDVGGDTAAHVVAVYYFIHHLLPRLQLSGWDPQWFDGFPLYTFYFPLPALLVAFFSIFAPYAVAFKMVTALGAVTLPLAAYAFGRLAGLRRPLPALLCVATVPYLFNNAYTIDGGNVLSTMAGEFSFSLALTFAVLFLGVFVRSLRTGRLRWLAVVLFVLTVLSHVVPALFAAGAATVLVLVSPDATGAPRAPGDEPPGPAGTVRFVARRFADWVRPAYARPLGVLVSVGVAGGLISAFWLVPFYVYGVYDGLSSSMNYGRVPGNLWANTIPHNGELVVLLLALVGAVVGFARRERIAIALAIVAIASAALFQLAPSGLVYNGRWIPFWYLSTALLAAFGTRDLFHGAFAGGRVAAYLAAALAVRRGVTDDEAIAALTRERARRPGRLTRGEEIVTPVLTGAVVVLAFASWLGVLPFANLTQRNYADNWANFNYSGYQSRPGWPELQRVVTMLDRVGAHYGCGRLDYEYPKNISNLFGSTLAPMSLPLWTNGCIGSAEGVYYESSTTTDFHFLDQAELSMDASNPVGGLPYQTLNVADGVRHLQLEGVRYFLANSPTVEQQAAADPSLVELASTPASPDSVDTTAAVAPAPPPGGYHWIVYEIRSSQLVMPLSHEPVVEAGIGKRLWQSTAITWYQNEQYWSVPIARDGPASWPREAPGSLVGPGNAVPVVPTTVSHISTTDSTLSFDASRLGVPVLVKEPYFPNWQASGASGPYEVSPNLMVVVPTAHRVVLRYGTTAVDWAGRGATMAGVAVLATLLFTSPRPAPDPVPNGLSEQTPVPGGDAPGSEEPEEVGGPEGGTMPEAGSSRPQKRP